MAVSGEESTVVPIGRPASAAAAPPIARRQLQQIISGASDGIVLLEPDGTIIDANDAALAMHGCRTKSQLGRDAAAYGRRFELRYRNHHAVEAKQYPMARLRRGEAFDAVTVVVTRRADPESSRVHEVRGLLLTDGRGEVESLATISKDVTQRVSAEECFERAFSANPAPALIFRLTDGHYVKVNQGFLDMTGFAAEDVLDHPYRELDVLRRAESRQGALAALREHRTIPQQEAQIRIAGGKAKYVIVAGQPIELDEERCMLFTFNDLDARKRAELGLQESEERFARAFRSTPVPLMVCARGQWVLLEVNDALMALTGRARGELVGQRLAAAGFHVDRKARAEWDAALEASPTLRVRSLQLNTADGGVIDCLLSAERVTIRDQDCLLCAVEDVTERKRFEDDLSSAIETVMKDASWFSRSVMERLARIHHPAEAGDALDTLTPREREVLNLICSGQTDAEMAKGLRLSRNTIRNYVAAVYDKLGVNRRSAAVIWGRERGLGPRSPL
ncbi:MAG TPA: helix-turn-helix transcriptional regulator [Nevskiaceae bacterium]